MDWLEAKVREERAEIDTFSTPEHIEDLVIDNWKKPKRNLLIYWKAAAILLVGITIGLVIGSNEEQAAPPPVTVILDEEYVELTAEYSEQIDRLEQDIRLDRLNRKEFDWIFRDLEHLEEINLLYQEDMGSPDAQHKTIRVLLDYYEKRIKILKRLEKEIKRKKNEEYRNIAA
ncbi:MAG: hypothetical protein JXQ90_20195 [Cyclobacteriaceae bacterium]